VDNPAYLGTKKKIGVLSICFNAIDSDSDSDSDSGGDQLAQRL